MTETIPSLVPVAIGVAISPAPIIELILVMFSRRRIPNSVAFVVTLIVLTAARSALGAAGQQAGEKSGGGTSTGVAIVLAGLGALLLLVGVATGATAPTRRAQGLPRDLRHGAGRRRVPGLRRGLRQPQEPGPARGRRPDDRARAPVRSS